MASFLGSLRDRFPQYKNNNSFLKPRPVGGVIHSCCWKIFFNWKSLLYHIILDDFDEALHFGAGFLKKMNFIQRQ